jgi:hypothetical protein
MLRDEEARDLVERLIASGAGEKRRRPTLVWVHDWWALTDYERRLIARAQDAAKTELANERAARGRRAITPADREAWRDAQLRKNKRHHSAEQRRWLHANMRGFRGAERWQRVAWHEAYEQRKLSRFFVRTIVVLCVLVVGVTTRNGWLAIAATIPAYLGLHAIERLRIRIYAHRLSRELEDARARSRHIPTAMRAAVMERDGYACTNCGKTEDLHIDHRYPFSRGGETRLDNLQVLCASCNIRKGARVDVHGDRS